ncbi:MAG: 2,3-bisphosphoglycerate-independent phosphoglycerate mutase [Candidatus Micrarchaeia archaeon]
MEKILLVVFDGLGDRPLKEFGKKTPLEAAKTPNLNGLAAMGTCGQFNSIGVGVRPGSDTAHLSLFGYDLTADYRGRGPIEALGVGFDLRDGDVAFRANFGTVDENGKIVDRRAGRIKDVSSLAKSISGKKIGGVTVFVVPSVSHRAVLVLRGAGLSAAVCDGDPHKDGRYPIKITPTSQKPSAKKTSKALNDFLSFASKTLKNHALNKKRADAGRPQANYLLVRGAGVYKKLLGFEKKYGLKAACVAGGGLYKGVSRLVGMRVLNVKGATGTPDTNVEAKVSAALTALDKHDFVFLHLKGADAAAEDGNGEAKKEFIEKADAALWPLLKLKNTIVCVTADHSTPCALKMHSGDPSPILFYGQGIRTDGSPVKKFGERQCAKGDVGRVFGKDLISELLNLSGRARLVGD